MVSSWHFLMRMFVLGVRMVGWLWQAGRHWALQNGLLQLIEHSRVLFGEEGDGHTTLTCSSCAANMVDVILNVLGHVIVDDHRYILDVHTTTHHICSHQNILDPSLEVG